MKEIIKIAWRNLFRYSRRTLLTASLIGIGTAFVLVASGLGNSFRKTVISTITDSNLGDLQIHRQGYVGSIDNLPLDKVINEKQIGKIEEIIAENKFVKAHSRRIRFSAMLSSYVQTTGMRITAVLPQMESAVCPDLPKRIKQGNSNPENFVTPGNIVIPQNVAAGMNIKMNDSVVLIANNKDGSVNGLTLIVSGISENILGPAGKDGYMHLDDAMSLLRIEDHEITEIALKLENFDHLDKAYKSLDAKLSQMGMSKQGKRIMELHTWRDLSPFSSIARIVALLIIVVRIMLVSIVLISVLNVMIMSVYERMGEIGTIAAMGASPFTILSLFLSEGLIIGAISAGAGLAGGSVFLGVLSIIKVRFTFGSMNLALAPQILPGEIALTFFLVTVVAALASIQPALKASRVEIVETLRQG